MTFVELNDPAIPPGVAPHPSEETVPGVSRFTRSVGPPVPCNHGTQKIIPLVSEFDQSTATPRLGFRCGGQSEGMGQAIGFEVMPYVTALVASRFWQVTEYFPVGTMVVICRVEEAVDGIVNVWIAVVSKWGVESPAG